MKKKIIAIVIIASIVTVIIYNTFKTDKINLVALGDGVASGMTSYNVEGYSFNDYLRDYLKDKNMLDHYVRDFVKKGIRVEDLVYILENNQEIEYKNSKITVMQAIANANLITVSVGSDELASSTIITDSEVINNITNQMELAIKKIRSFSSKKIIIVGLYYSPLYKNSDVDKINEKYETIANDYNGIYIDPKETINNYTYFANTKTHYINYKGHELIKNSIVDALEFNS